MLELDAGVSSRHSNRNTGICSAKPFSRRAPKSYEACGVLAAQFTNGSGDEDSIGLSFAAQSKSEVHRRAEQVVVFSHRFPGVDPDPDPEILRRFGVVGGEPPLNISGGTDRVCHLVEHRHDAVARVLHLAPAMRCKPASYEAIMHPHQLECGDVAETGRQLGRTDDVGDQDGAQSRIHVCAPRVLRRGADR